MKTKKNFLVFLIAILAVSVFAVSVSALDVVINRVDLNGLTADSTSVVAGFSGEILPVKVIFTSNEDEGDVRVIAWLSGYKDEIEDSSGRMHLISGSTYTETLSLRLPEDIDLSEEYRLYVRVEGKTGNVERSFNLRMQRESYEAELIELQVKSTAKAGDSLPITVVVKNKGYEELEDLVVVARLLGTDVVARAYLSDLPSVDAEDDDEEDNDAIEKVLTIDLPSNLASGTYTLEVKAENDDFETVAKRSITVTGVDKMTNVYVAERSKEAKAGEEAEFEITLVNLANEVKVYEFVPEPNGNLAIDTEPTILAVPKGESRTFVIKATADKKGTYNFVVRVVADGKVVSRISLNMKATSGFFDTETTIAIVLAIVFAILLIVLIVLLTKKPQKVAEFEESYY